MTDVIENKRPVKADEQATRCGECCALATHSCTDARQTNGEWQESPTRYGCAAHPVQSNIYFEDGPVISAAAYEKQQC